MCESVFYVTSSRDITHADRWTMVAQWNAMLKRSTWSRLSIKMGRFYTFSHDHNLLHPYCSSFGRSYKVSNRKMSDSIFRTFYCRPQTGRHGQHMLHSDWGIKMFAHYFLPSRKKNWKEKGNVYDGDKANLSTCVTNWSLIKWHVVDLIGKPLHSVKYLCYRYYILYTAKVLAWLISWFQY